MVNQYLQFLRTTILIQAKIDYSICLEAVRLNLISSVERSLQSQNPATRLQAQGPNPLMGLQSPHMGPQSLLMVLRAKPNLLTKHHLMQSKLNIISKIYINEPANNISTSKGVETNLYTIKKYSLHSEIIQICF